MTCQVGNIDEAHGDGEAAGAEIALTRRDIAPGVRLARARDPDGNVVEFVQRG